MIVDAIDEADQDEREDILNSLARLVSLAPSIRVLITGRPDEDIVAWVEKSSGISSFSQAISEVKIPDAAAAQDIETYIDSRILRSSKLRHPAVAQQIKRDVIARAERMFLYVRLMLDELEIESSVGAVRLRLEKFPRSLNDYETVFRRISNDTDSARELAQNLLAWVTTSYEPMHIDTVLVALQSQALSKIPSVGGPTKDDVDEVSLLDPLKQIRSICFPLLEVTESGIVQLVHCSVAAYILNTGMSAHPEQDSSLLLTLTQASQEIALACIHFLRFDPEWSIPEVTGDAGSAFSDYSTKYWPEHLSESHQDDLVDIPLLFETMAPEQKWFVDWVARRSKLDYTFQKTFLLGRNGLPSCLEIAAYFNITSWATAIIQCQSRHSTSLFPEMIAAARGSLDILRLFHQRASDSGSRNTQHEFLLHVAARNGHHAVVRYLIVERGWDVNAIDSFGRSALMHACSHGHTVVINELLKQDANVSVVSPAGYNAADGAAAIGDIQSLTVLISRSHSGVTLNSLFLSSANGHASVVEYLLQHTLLDPNGADKNSWTSLHWACRNGHRDVVKLLVAYGATVDAHDSDGRTPLNRAVRIGDSEIVQTLLQAGASPVSRDSSGLSLTHFASAGGFTEVLSLLLGAGVDPNDGELSQQSQRNEAHNLTASGPPLHHAAEMGHTAAVSYLLEHGADVDKKGPDCETALQKACDAGQESVVRILLDANANHESCGNSGEHRIPLAIAVKNLHIGIVSILAPIAWSKADTTATGSVTFCEESPISAAIRAAVECDNVKILANLFSYAPHNLHLPTCVKLNVFNETFRDGNPAFAEFLGGLGFDLSKSALQNEQYPTPLGYAVQGQNLPMVKFLLDGKVNPIEFSSMSDENFEDHNHKHLTALDAAVLARNIEILSLLSKRQRQLPDVGNPKEDWPCFINRSELLNQIHLNDFQQESLTGPRLPIVLRPHLHVIPEPLSRLFCAISKNDPTELQRQIDNGVDVNELDWEFETPLARAIKAGNPDIVACLLESGADVAFRASNGSPLVTLACGPSHCHTTIVRMLLCAGAPLEGLTLTKACSSQNLDLVRLLLDVGVNPNLYVLPEAAWEVRAPPLFEVVNSSNDAFVEEAVPLLLNAGARAGDEHYKDETVLHIAVDRERPFLLQKLVETGVPIDVCDIMGEPLCIEPLLAKLQ